MRTALDEQHDVRVSQVDKEFGVGSARRLALRNLSIDIQRSKTIAIVGPSGCGKTTLLRIIAGLEMPTNGSVWRHHSLELRKSIYVHQFPRLLPWRTMLQNASLGIEMTTRLGAGHVDHIRELIDRFGLHGFEAHYPNELSGGMQQRTALIRAMACRPGLMLCDEPFSSIDFVNRLTLSATFKYQCKIDGITTVVVTHNIDEAIFLGDVVYALTGRPGTVKRFWVPQFVAGRTDAIACRRSPEFARLFEEIWSELEN